MILFLLVAWYLVANVLGESINLPQLTVSLIPAFVGSWLAMRILSERLEVALSIWMVGLAVMMGLAGYFFERPEMLVILLPLSTIGVLVVNWWDLVSARTLAGVFPDGFPGWDLEHAAVIETSLVFALAPDLVRTGELQDETMEFVPSYTVLPQPKGLVPESGLLSKSTPASLEKGRLLVEEVLGSLVDIFRREFPEH